MCLEQVWSDIGSAPGNDRIKLHSIRIQMEDATLANQITLNTPFAIEIDYWNLKPNTCLNLSLALYNEAGICVFVTTTLQESRWHGQPFPVGLFRSICHIPESLLNDGIYRVVLRFVKDTSIVLFCYEEAAVFEVLDVGEGRGDWYGKWIGTVRPNLCWNTELVYSI
jgi:lipopolysaccharide transport system ATP-binding protein